MAWMTRSLIPLFFLFLAVAPGSAEEPNSDPGGRCRALFDRLVAPILTVKEPRFASAAAKGADGCLFGNVTAQIGPSFLDIDAIDVDHAAFLTSKNLPMPKALRVSVTGVTFGLKGNPVYNYILKASSYSPSLMINYKYDEATKALDLRDFSLEWGRGKLNVSGSVLGFVPGGSNALPGMTLFTLSLKSLKLTLSDPDSSIQRPFMQLVGFRFLEGSTDPAAKSAELRRQAADWLHTSLPPFNISKDSISALVDAIQAFPKAGKRFDVEINPPKPVGIADLAPVIRGDKPGKDLFPDGAVKVTYGD